ncbi:transcriptional regulator [Vibrio orientalis CIP 102891 = ATCC 33934]|uniref:Transcriptional regulator n=1 Tax=Vibrio orientalis CIP 102891 = ATCC 33934 TaxID=675816 RepID=C9QBX1_VIBOR|nr:TetR/AcrR family transcriptional regulator [Vibrio orientalis]EEX95565.1 transcriptional regulator TetR family [Vibrio orientalis CIP 102891 = ATCC 33934]EGU46729.1 transcriptional regulator [Vibrio orientalis CIP 102891 = ATCC 33934]
MKDKRQKIIDAAEALIAESGFQGLSMHKLAKEAGVAAGTIYRYFSDKEDLLQQVRLEVAQRNAEAIQRDVDESMPLKERFRKMWLNIFDLSVSNIDNLKNRAQYDSLPCVRSHETKEIERKMFSKVDQLFTEGRETGVFKPLGNPVLAALSLEVSVTLARKQSLGYYQLDQDAIEAAIEASWDAIITH